MKTLLTLTLAIILFNSTVGQTSDKDLVVRAALNYLEGFYEGDTLKLHQSLKPDLLKYGYWKNRETGEFGDEIYMSFEEAKDYARQVKERGNYPAGDAPKEVEILDVMEHIAAVKVTAWWGVDYLLLSKEDDVWMIGQVIWEGPLKQ